ncbi:hypothetical protein BT69DRAFT_1323763, partial [Atractiella rhizophila]
MPTSIDPPTLATEKSNLPVENVVSRTGRVVDYFPNHLCDFVTRYCGECQLEFSLRAASCPSCKTSDLKLDYKFFLCLEDGDGETETIVVSGDEATTFLSNLQPADVYRDSAALLRLRKTLRRLIGNLDEVKEGFVDGP